ncbi:ligand-gated ion channel [Mucilaginibacter ginkgonis]|uniref:Neurotransmitter-gated ion-channel n=1 Tax=Mucilaginibacter ginkgonis TaxID=2682091 RepID=A0A6I4HU08_9SPHI|nr:hypothetical protein [Mucilaginibacter ginkgonis]QQL50434.1 hypothetical protein GO620_002975 [Mucilaginibacter ginkgonis]
MNKLLAKILITFTALFVTGITYAQKPKPDTVTAGLYITSIHDINFKDKEYTADMWLWLRYKKKEFDFIKNLEVPQAKTVTKSFTTVDSSNNKIFILMKLQCVMKDSWAINNFPFDSQKLRFSIENSQFDSKAIIFKIDNRGQHFDPRFTLNGWAIDSISLTSGIKKYETAFGDSIVPPHTEYSNFKAVLRIHRDAMGLFWKMFLGMYVAFLIAYMCFYIHADSIDSRFGLSVGALFAVIGNKYIIDNTLPESTTFTLVDTLHGLTLLFILATIICNTFSLRLIKTNKLKEGRRFDFISAQVVLVAYLVLNGWFIYTASRG